MISRNNYLLRSDVSYREMIYNYVILHLGNLEPFPALAESLAQWEEHSICNLGIVGSKPLHQQLENILLCCY